MKSLASLCLTVLLCSRGTAAELSIWQIESSRKEGVTEVPGQSGFKILLGAQLLVMKAPDELTLGSRRTLYQSARHGTYSVGDSPHFTIPLEKEQLEKLATGATADSCHGT